MKKVAILQSNYIPWKGYFHIIHDVDDFVFLDSVQYTTRDWRNRNLIKTREGLLWLTVPVRADRSTSIAQAKIDGTDWQQKHYMTICHNYHTCRRFDHFNDLLQDVYLDRSWDNLYELNRYFIKKISVLLGIETTFHGDEDFTVSEDRNLRLLSIARELEADIYVSGPAAKNYLDVALFEKEGIGVEFFQYPEYPIYPQPYGDFEHRVSILDLLLNVGNASPRYIWGGSS